MSEGGGGKRIEEVREGGEAGGRRSEDPHQLQDHYSLSIERLQIQREVEHSHEKIISKRHQ